MKQILFSFLTLLCCVGVFGQDEKCDRVLDVLNKVTNACQAYPPQDYCNVFVGQAINDIYGLSDFVNSSSVSGYYEANAIADLLITTLSNSWSIIGTCDNQDVLNNAQNDANSNQCVIAVWKNPGGAGSHGHIALILPGNLLSGWNGMMVPNAANFSLGTDKNNFVCNRLSGAFGYDKISAVTLYVHHN